VLRHTHDGTWGYSLYEDEAAAAGSERVALVTLDDVLQDERPAIVKCNAEGAEYSLFEHLTNTDVRPEFMVVMVHPEFGDMDRLVEQARAMDYTCSRVGTSNRPAFHMWRTAG
jgi:hypothetical protein